MTPLQLPGAYLAASSLALPAAAMRMDPFSRAASITCCSAVGQVVSTAKDMLMTFAGALLAGTPSIVPPDAQLIDAAMSLSNPPRQDRARIGWMLAPGATSLIRPAIFVPCQLLDRAGEVSRQSPGSAGFASRPISPKVLVSV